MCGGPNVAGTEATLTNLAQEQGARSKTAFETALPQEQETLRTGIPGMGTIMDASGGTVAQAFAPGRAQLVRALQQAGIQPSDPRYIAAMAQFTEGEGKAFDANMVQNIMSQFQAKQGAGKDLLQVAAQQSPEQALALLLQAQLSA